MAYNKVNKLSDNNFEKWWKKRHNNIKNRQYMWGEKGPMAKITNKDAYKIIDLYNRKMYNQKELGNMFGVDPSQISRIVTGKRHFE